MKARERWLGELKARIPEVSPREALALQALGAALVDVRDSDEIAQGTAPGALRLGRSYLELRIEEVVPDAERPLVLPGVIGLLQATEAIKLLLGIGQPLVGRLLVFDALRASFSELTLERDPRCAYCGDGCDFPGYVDYQRFCARAAA